MNEKELIQVSIRVDKKTLKGLQKLLGLSDTSKTVRASMNFTLNVSQRLFSGNLSNMFKRKKANEEQNLYDQNL